MVTRQTKSYELVCDMLLGIRVTVSKVRTHFEFVFALKLNKKIKKKNKQRKRTKTNNNRSPLGRWKIRKWSPRTIRSSIWSSLVLGVRMAWYPHPLTLSAIFSSAIMLPLCFDVCANTLALTLQIIWYLLPSLIDFIYFCCSIFYNYLILLLEYTPMSHYYSADIFNRGLPSLRIDITWPKWSILLLLLWSSLHAQDINKIWSSLFEGDTAVLLSGSLTHLQTHTYTHSHTCIHSHTHDTTGNLVTQNFYWLAPPSPIAAYNGESGLSDD